MAHLKLPLMATLLAWQQPQVVRDQSVTRDLLEAKSLRRQAVILPLLLGVPTFIACRLSGERYTVLIPVVLLSMGVPLLMAQTCADSRTQRYEIDATGISSFHGRPTLINRSLLLKVPWRNIRIYEFRAHPDFPQVRSLVVPTGKLGVAFRFHFDPNQVDENQMRSLIQQYASHAREIESSH